MAERTAEELSRAMHAFPHGRAAFFRTITDAESYRLAEYEIMREDESVPAPLEEWPGQNLRMDVTGFSEHDIEVWRRVSVATDPDGMRAALRDFDPCEGCMGCNSAQKELCFNRR